MDDFKKIAIMLIYPDGEIEKIPIGEHVLHFRYYQEHLTSSPRFYQICGNLDFGSNVFHDNIDRELLLNGVIIVFNLDIEDIVNGYFDFPDEEPYLSLVFSKICSLEQVLALEAIVNNYPLDYIEFRKYDNDSGLDIEISKESLDSYIKVAKDEFGTRSI